MKEPNFDFGDKFDNAISKIEKAVGSTMGPAGKLAAIQMGNGRAYFTKDGITVGKNITLVDPIENMCLQAIVEASSISNKVGDGTSHAVVLACAFYKELKRNPSLKNKFADLLTKTYDFLDKMAKPADNDILEAVANISSNGDKEIVDLVCKAIQHVGKDGLIRVEESFELKSNLTILDGFECFATWTHRAFCNKGILATSVEPLVFCTMERLHTLGHFQNIMPLLEYSRQSGRPLIIAAPDIMADVLKNLVSNQQQKVLNTICVKFGDFTENLEDFAAISGSYLRDINTEDPFNKLEPDELGELTSIEVSPQKLFCVPTSKTFKNEQLAFLKAKLENSIKEVEKIALKGRIAALESKVAKITVGGTSQSEIFEKLDRFDDAVAAVFSAAKSGVVGGGGQTLRLIGSMFGNDAFDRVLNTPTEHIKANAGKTIDIPTDMAWDVRNDELVYPFDAKIIDPVDVVKTALEAAFSVSVLLVNTATVVYS